MVVDDTKVDLNVFAGDKAVSTSLISANFKPESPVVIHRYAEVPDGKDRRIRCRLLMETSFQRKNGGIERQLEVDGTRLATYS